METIVLSSEPLPMTESTITLNFFDPKDLDPRSGTRLSQRKARDGRITFNPDSCKIFALSPKSGSNTALMAKQKNARHDLYLMHMPFTLHKILGTGYYEEITFQVEIEDEQATAFDYFPEHIDIPSGEELEVTVATDFTITRIEKDDHPVSRPIRFPVLYPTITAGGKGESYFYWLYEASVEQMGVIPGTKNALFVLQVPRGTSSVIATITGETVIAKPLSYQPSYREMPSGRVKTERHKVCWDLTNALPFFDV